MAYFLFALFIVLPLLELWVLIQVGTVIGALPTLALVVAISLFGAWMVRRQSLAALLKAQGALNAGHMPVGAVADGAGLMLAALLIMTPGLITSGIGVLLLVPPIRRWLTAQAMRALLKNAVVTGTGFPGGNRHARRPDHDGPIKRPSRASPKRGTGPIVDAEFEAINDGGSDPTSSSGPPEPDGDQSRQPASPWRRP